MGYAVYEDRAARDLGVKRWAGYGVPAVCDFPSCEADIDRGVAYRCERVIVAYIDDHRALEEDGCELHFCPEHLDDHEAHDGIIPKPDHAQWVEHMLTDETWGRWRADNSDEVETMRNALAEAVSDGYVLLRTDALS